jgi:uncharacterized membrane protein
MIMDSEHNMWNIFDYIFNFLPNSTQGFLLALLLCCGYFLTILLVCGFSGIILFLLFKIYSILFTIVGSGLGISAGVEIFIWMIAICCANVNIPLNWLGGWYRHLCHKLRSVWRSPRDRENWQKTSICINITGGLIPTILSLYQFSRVEANAIFVVLVIVATIGFCSVVVVPGVGIFSRRSNLTITSLVAALYSIWIAPATERVGVAFAGCVLGHLIGADLLHLKDLQLERSPTPVNIGGDGMEDGIISCGFSALLFAEYLPKLVPFLTDIVRLFRFTPHF